MPTHAAQTNNQVLNIHMTPDIGQIAQEIIWHIKQHYADNDYLGTNLWNHLAYNNADLIAMYQDTEGKTILMHLVIRNCDSLISYINVLFRCSLMGLNITDCHGKTALMYAAEVGNITAISCLYKHEELETTLKTFKDGYTALMLACIQGHQDCIDFLISHPNKILSSERQKSLVLAAEHGHLGIVKILLTDAASYSKEALEWSSKKALEKAIDNNHYDVVRYLSRAHTLCSIGCFIKSSSIWLDSVKYSLKIHDQLTLINGLVYASKLFVASVSNVFKAFGLIVDNLIKGIGDVPLRLVSPADAVNTTIKFISGLVYVSPNEERNCQVAIPLISNDLADVPETRECTFCQLRLGRLVQNTASTSMGPGSEVLSGSGNRTPLPLCRSNDQNIAVNTATNYE